MNKTFLLFFLTFSAFGAHLPEFTQGEIKINYPCGTESLIPKNKEENELITFFERGNNEFYKEGYILRRRVSDGASDFTVKYRSHDPFSLNKDLYQELLGSTAGELKCELDFTYHPVTPTFSRSCSFKSDTEDAVREHGDFILMIGKEMGGIETQELKRIMIHSTSWKAKQIGPFIKKPSIEKWMLGNQCRLEVSGKLSNLSFEAVQEGFNFLLKLVPKAPSSDQSSKTSWALGFKY